MKQLTTGEFCSAAHKKAYLAEQEKFALARLLENQKRIGGMAPASTPLPEKKKPVKRKAGGAKGSPEDEALASIPVEGTYLVEKVRTISARPILALPSSNPSPALVPVLPEGAGVLITDRDGGPSADAVPPAAELVPHAEYAVQELRGFEALFSLLERVDVREEPLLSPRTEIAAVTLPQGENLAGIASRAGQSPLLEGVLEYPSAEAKNNLAGLWKPELVSGQELHTNQSLPICPKPWAGQVSVPAMHNWFAVAGETQKVAFYDRKPRATEGFPVSQAVDNGWAGVLVPEGDDGAILGPYGAWAMQEAFCAFPARPASQWENGLSLNLQAAVELPAGFHEVGLAPRGPRPPYENSSSAEPFLAKARVACMVASEIRPAQPRGESRLIHLNFDLGTGSAPARKLRANGEMRFGKIALLMPSAKSKVRISHEHQSVFSALGHLTGGSAAFSWKGFRAQWAKVPNDLRWVALAIPLVIGLIWFSSQPGEAPAEGSRRPGLAGNRPADAAVAETREEPGWLGKLTNDDSLDELKRSIQQRAAIELSDDFRQGLADWSGVGDWASGWRYDGAGFLRPRRLALYTPSLDLSDYRLEFLAHIETKALSWVFRAADVQNYYVNRLEIINPEPLPTVVHVRYAVVNGKAGPRKVTRLPMQVQLDTLYRVRVDVKGSDFVTSIQGQVVDVFSDDRMPRGGIGFFANPGEDVRLRWVEVSHQYDFLGRLCAFLVPYNVSNNNLRSGQ